MLMKAEDKLNKYIDICMVTHSFLLFSASLPANLKELSLWAHRGIAVSSEMSEQQERGNSVIVFKQTLLLKKTCTSIYKRALRILWI